MQFVVYVLIDKCGKRYTGYMNDFVRRLWEHNNGITITTRKGINWRPIFTKEFDSKHEAIMFERFLKSGKGREYLSQRLGE